MNCKIVRSQNWFFFVIKINFLFNIFWTTKKKKKKQFFLFWEEKKNTSFFYKKRIKLGLGMTTGRVRARFFHTRTRPAGQDLWPRPVPFRVLGFFLGPGPAPAGPRGPRLEIGPNSWPNQKKKPRFIFSYVQAQIYFCRSSLHIPNKKIKPKYIFAYIQASIFKFKPR